MTIRSGFFNSKDGDRLYSADDMSKPYEHFFTDGVYPSSNGENTDLKVVWAGSNNPAFVKITPGGGIFAGKWVELSGTETVRVANGQTTMDSIVSIILRIDTSENVRNATIESRRGALASSPVAPDLVDTVYIKEYRLANVYVPAGATEISESSITDTREISTIDSGLLKVPERFATVQHTRTIGGGIRFEVSANDTYLVTSPKFEFTLSDVALDTTYYRAIGDYEGRTVCATIEIDSTYADVTYTFYGDSGNQVVLVDWVDYSKVTVKQILY